MPCAQAPASSSGGTDRRPRAEDEFSSAIGAQCAIGPRNILRPARTYPQRPAVVMHGNGADERPRRVAATADAFGRAIFPRGRSPFGDGSWVSAYPSSRYSRLPPSLVRSLACASLSPKSSLDTRYQLILGLTHPRRWWSSERTMRRLSEGGPRRAATQPALASWQRAACLDSELLHVRGHARMVENVDEVDEIRSQQLEPDTAEVAFARGV